LGNVTGYAMLTLLVNTTTNHQSSAEEIIIFSSLENQIEVQRESHWFVEKFSSIDAIRIVKSCWPNAFIDGLTDLREISATILKRYFFEYFPSISSPADPHGRTRARMHKLPRIPTSFASICRPLTIAFRHF
jgi:hypothetical protein